MSDCEYRPEFEILSVTDTGRRRRWTDAEKVRIVEESFGPRGSVAETARRSDVGRTLLVRWRRQYRSGALLDGSTPLSFMPVTLAANYCQIWCLRISGHAAIWLFSVASIPSLNATPVMTLAR